MKILNTNFKFMKKELLIFFVLFIISNSVLSQNGTGLIFLDESEYKDIPLATTAMMGTLPSQKDLSDWFPEPGQQGQQSSCVGWAVSYGLKSYQEAIERRRKPKTNDHLYSPSFVYNQIKLADCGGGSRIVDALNFLKRSGTATLSDFPYTPYDCSNTPTPSVSQIAKNYTIADWRRVNVSDQIEVKSQLNSGFPIVIGMIIDTDFERLGYNEVFQGVNGIKKGGHAMVVVGFDDSKQAYKLLNSWGTNWGTNGYGWISYSAFEKVREAYTAQDVVINNPDAIIEPQNNDVNVPIPPPVPPNAIEVYASLGQPIITHNQMVQSPIGWQYGMIISIPGNIVNGKGSYAQIVLRFYLPNGQPLIANLNESVFRDAHGLVATGTTRGPVINDPAPLAIHTITIPYYALNFQPTNGVMTYNVSAQATLYINEYEKSKSAMTPMIIKW
jgi:hypothetical protein